MSSPDLLYVLHITVADELVEATDAALALLGANASRWEDADGGDVRFDVFSSSEDASSELESILREQLAQFSGAHPWHIEATQIANENWQESWKAYFHVERVSERIVTKPSWEAYTPQPGDCVIEIDPGMSFGTGQHATTKGCLCFLDRLAGETEAGSFLDLGCGSGILSIAAAKLGYGPITAVDIDDDAVRIAAGNLAANGVSENIETLAADVAEWNVPHPYNVVAANILAPVLIANAERIAAAVSRHGGHLLLAGILTEQFNDVAATYTALGFRELDKMTEAEWTSGCFCLKLHSRRPAEARRTCMF